MEYQTGDAMTSLWEHVLRKVAPPDGRHKRYMRFIDNCCGSEKFFFEHSRFIQEDVIASLTLKPVRR